MVTLYVRIIERKCRSVPVISGRIPRVACRREHGIALTVPVIVCNAVAGILPQSSECDGSAIIRPETCDIYAGLTPADTTAAYKSRISSLSVNDVHVPVHAGYVPSQERAAVPCRAVYGYLFIIIDVFFRVLV